MSQYSKGCGYLKERERERLVRQKIAFFKKNFKIVIGMRLKYFFLSLQAI